MATDHPVVGHAGVVSVACFFVESDQPLVAEYLKLISSLGFAPLPCSIKPQNLAPTAERVVPQQPTEGTISVLFASVNSLNEALADSLREQLAAISPQSGMVVQLQELPAEHALAAQLSSYPGINVATTAPEAVPGQFAKALLELADRQRQAAGGSDQYEDSQTQLLPRSLVIQCAGKEHVVPMNFRGLATIGRGNSCHICLDSNFVSRLHGCFRSNEGQFSYRDMSSNGTILLYEHEELLLQEEEVDLPPRGRLRIGDLELGFAILGE